MHALFEDAGKFLAGRILSEADASSQIELASGKRVKVKAANVLLKFEKPEPAELMAKAEAIAASVELDLAWEFAPEEEFGFADIARDYFSESAPLSEQAGMLFALYGAPHYFRRAGKGRFKKAPAEILQQALAAIEKKKQLQAQIDAWAQELVAGTCPPAIREQLYKILFKPDKNAPEYKAVVEASRSAQKAPLELLQAAGAIDSAYQFHWKRFLFENFPKGTAFPAVTAPQPPADLPLAAVQAYSIDDSMTTEIDDALSVQGLGTGTVTVGIHIAAPGLAITPGSDLDKLGRARLSTVYMPGYKITMLPDEVVQIYTLDEGRANPAVSLYVTYDEATLEVKDKVTKLERVPVAVNFRHDKLDHIVTEAWLQDPSIQIENTPQPLLDKREELSFLHRLAQHLKAGREQVRGKPENFSRPDYTFRLDGNGDNEPQGHETVSITVRKRGAPLDLIVAEAAIVANSTWGLMLAEYGVPGIYRSQASLAPGVKVRMSTKALPHAGIGVKAYSWATSPLRRYTDLVNQWQIIACARHGATAALAAPFKPKDAELFGIISSFDGAYSAYNGYQAGMERFWTLKYLEQNAITELDGAVIKDNGPNGVLVRADSLPLVISVAGAQALPRGARVRVKLGEIDEITLDIHGTVTERLDDPQDPSDDAPLDDSADDEEDVAGPIAIAVDVNESDSPSADNSNP
ncbi:ribonuclease catalytic domain-containing protein [Comamonas aquatica]|uniref:Ribonuclease II n=1 Tax=Comamonas aquatica DA1877 TaxID=1457173 RepID=A0A014MT49_9BURK|nr:RNB domain-containing ribonuclease [Comamonas aquatica]EXU81204.1 ribonuclease II [Comamonas aquatica DA1877]MDH0380342.1 RNB domain-containing ribonuclease [Comamonas aquatica]MDH0428362.1 RNB domain-containing ribonuclease [Comamonas aquatica]MDH0898124.1 RNB domain-containing ribonuclease [Comamonas aquatica]MDH0939635.1 RNB domain-containing ribonuclease [Comamonas aquatica]